MIRNAADVRAEALPRPETARAGLPDILYIMGTGRSGTTILEILLASNPGFTGVGEVKYIFRDGYLRDQPCACGRTATQCELWSAVLRSTNWNPEDCKKIGSVIERIESHARFPLTFAHVIPSGDERLYRLASEALFASVGAAKHSKVVVDSSKHAGRAITLARLFPDSVKVLCITRSAEGILNAFQKKNDGEQRPKGPLAVAAYYIYVLLCMSLVRRRLKDRCFAIRFEDLNRSPEAVLTAIERWAGYSLASAKAKLAEGDVFDVGHIVTGNRIRKKGRVRFEPSAAGSSVPSSAARRVLASVLEKYREWMGF